MAPVFHRLTADDFDHVLSRFHFTRAIDTVHLHHTWRPRQSDFTGRATIESMWRHHTQVNGWSDIAQHVSIDPEGFIWTGRSFNTAPASAAGHNGNARLGPFMIEMIGDFDRGRERWPDAQKTATLRVITAVQRRFGLTPEALRLHNEMSSKTCPGSSIRKADVIAALRAEHERQANKAGARAAAPAEGAFPEDARRSHAVLVELMSREATAARGVADPLDAELKEEDEDVYAQVQLDARSDGVRSSARFEADQLVELRPHVINLRQGRLASSGQFDTSEADVRAIFEEHIPRWEKDWGGKPLRIVIWAHGGLVSESAGLAGAIGKIDFFRRNGVYPLFFIWETGLFETIGQLLDGSASRTRALARDVFDFTTDPLVEGAVRRLGGPLVWGGMKRSAERCSDDEGGATLVAKLLEEYLKGRDPAEVELHAVGHSAGSIFHAHFLPVALRKSAHTFRTLHFLAPAIRTDLFKSKMKRLLGHGIEHLTVYTMRKDLERADNCKHIYRKSLLYLIHHALEEEGRAPILGLEESIRSDTDLRSMLGITDNAAAARIVWSATAPGDAGEPGSESRTHGGFDDDAATLNSILRAIRPDAKSEALHFWKAPGGGRARAADWAPSLDWPEELSAPASAHRAFAASFANGGALGIPTAAPSDGASGATSSPSGRRRALCIGIDRYASRPLSGCVADARMWAETLGRLGFETQLVTDGQATYQNIVAGISALVRQSRSGDVVVVQYAGHGTHVPDVTGDESGGDTPGDDEALCPFDMDTGALLIDDDLARIFKDIPDGVNVTCFFDCCHSGTSTRLGVGAPAQHARSADERPRYIVASPELVQAHRRFRMGAGGSRAAARTGPAAMREVLFAACLSNEVAWESNGHGEFTLRATRILAQGGTVTHEQFERQVREAFGPSPRQNPQLDCAPDARRRPLLQPTGATAPAIVTDGIVVKAGTLPPSVITRLLEIIAQLG